MEIIVACFPGTVCATKDNSIPFIQEHLGGATGMLLGIVWNHLENKTDITYAGSDMSKLPGRLRLCFVVKPRCDVPGDARRLLQCSDRISSSVHKLIRRECCLSNEL